MGKYQSEPVPVVIQVRISFHCDEKRELWPGVEPIFFGGNRHISERGELAVAGRDCDLRLQVYIASPGATGDWSPIDMTKAQFHCRSPDRRFLLAC